MCTMKFWSHGTLIFTVFLEKKEAWLLEDELMTSLDITPHILSI